MELPEEPEGGGVGPWLLQRLQPGEGWGLFLLVGAVLLALLSAVVQARWVPDLILLFNLALFHLLLGRWLARSQLPLWLTMAVDLLWGLFLAVLSVGRVWPSTAAWGQVLGGSTPFAVVLEGSRARFWSFLARLAAWWQAALTGGRSADNDIFLFYAVLLSWLVVAFALWSIYRGGRVLRGLAPLVTLAAISVYASQVGIVTLIAALGGAVLLRAVLRYRRVAADWDRRGVDFPGDVQVDLYLLVGGAALLLVLLGITTTLVNVRGIYSWLGRAFETPRAGVESSAGRLFEGVRPVEREPDAPGGQGRATLPRIHLLGGRPELHETVVMTVWTDEPAPPPEQASGAPRLTGLRRHYWRGAALDFYNSRGWQITSVRETPGAGDGAGNGAGNGAEDGETRLPPASVAPAVPVRQRYTLLTQEGGTLYTLYRPVTLTSALSVVWALPADAPLDAADPAGLIGARDTYEVLSQVPLPSARDLRAAPSDYPPVVAARYLQLPETLPARVSALAGQVAAAGQTPYDRARLIEQYLRGYPYTLDVNPPPADRDVVDYFLYTEGRGYCDYYASAMVVMARVVGIPARLALGYTEGDFDHAQGVYVVREINAHSWPELYFPGWGWVRFEPTAAEPDVALAAGEEQSLDELADEVPDPRVPAHVRLAHRGALAAALVAAAILGWAWHREQRRRPPVTLLRAWEQLERLQGRLGLPPDPAQTPAELMARLSGEVRRRAARPRHLRRFWAAREREALSALGQLERAYTAASYAGRPPTPAVDAAAARSLRTLRRALRWLQWVPAGRGREGQDEERRS